MASGLDQIRIEQETIGHILRDGRKLFVPVNQRSYRWEEEHVKHLYNDLAKAIGDSEREYFLGSIVVVKSAAQRLEVNDGQQRLATTMILIAAIRDYFSRQGDTATADKIDSDFLVTADRKTLISEPRFHLNNDDNQFFSDTILKRSKAAPSVRRKGEKPLKESNRRILKAKEIAAQHVDNIVKANPAGWHNELHKWLDFIEEGARVIWVQVTDERTAYIIFETMNDRGLKLSAADLLKNLIYGKAEQRRDEAVNKWQTMAGILEAVGDREDEVVEFIRYLWISKSGHIRSRALYDSIKETVKNQTAALNLATELEERSRDYAALVNASAERWTAYGPQARRQIEVLNLLGVKQVRPVLLAAQFRFSKTEFVKLLDGCIAWSVRCLISGVPSGTVEGYYARIAPKISDGRIKKAKEISPEVSQLVPDDERFEQAMSVAAVAQPHLSRYYLTALQLTEDGSPEPQYIPNDGKAVTLEHILPENPGEGWSHIKPEEAKANWKRLGNQALLAGSVNSKLGNVGFPAKKQALKDSPFSLTRMTDRFDDWNLEAIANRQRHLAKLAVKTWPIELR